MKCPMTFGDPCYDAERDCIREECAWWIVQRTRCSNKVYTASGCAIAVIAARDLNGAIINGNESTEEECGK